ncbi:MAG: hypothetical protein KC543_07510 [Myxococcales bacterium]|nr:hypothetical protein [Myxococcales bacterium]
MNPSLTVATCFADVAELAAGLIERVGDGRLILYGPEGVESNATLDFAVLLLDGSPVMAGRGRVVAAVDGGVDRAAQTRFDIVIDSLELDAGSEVVYERLLLARSDAQGDATPSQPAERLSVERADGQRWYSSSAPADASEPAPAASVPVTALESEPAPAASEPVTVVESAPAPAASDPGPARTSEPGVLEADAAFVESVPAGAMSERVTAEAEPGTPRSERVTVESVPARAVSDRITTEQEPVVPPSERVTVESVPAAAASTPAAAVEQSGPRTPPPPGRFGLDSVPPGVLSRSVLPPSWYPRAEPKAAPTASIGRFAHGVPLPIPAHPPRPDLAPALIVTRAPRPGDPVGPAPHTSSTPAADRRSGSVPVGSRPPSSESLSEAFWDDAEGSRTDSLAAHVERLSDSGPVAIRGSTAPDATGDRAALEADVEEDRDDRVDTTGRSHVS